MTKNIDNTQQSSQFRLYMNGYWWSLPTFSSLMAVDISRFDRLFVYWFSFRFVQSLRFHLLFCCCCCGCRLFYHSIQSKWIPFHAIFHYRFQFIGGLANCSVHISWTFKRSTFIWAYKLMRVYTFRYCSEQLTVWQWSKHAQRPVTTFICPKLPFY